MSWFGWGSSSSQADDGMVIPGLEAPESVDEYRALLDRKIEQMHTLLSAGGWTPIAFDAGAADAKLSEMPPAAGQDTEISIVKGEVTINAPSERVLGLLNSLDTEVLRRFDDTIIEVRLLKDVCDDIQVVSRHVQSPFPITNREVVALRHAKTNPDGSSIIIGSSINLRGMPETAGFVRANAIVASWLITPVDPATTRVVRLAQVDPRGNIPAAITNAFKQKLGHALLKLKACLEN